MNVYSLRALPCSTIAPTKPFGSIYFLTPDALLLCEDPFLFRKNKLNGGGHKGVDAQPIVDLVMMI